MRPRLLTPAVAAGALTLGLASCAGQQDDIAAFCREVTANEAALTAPVAGPEQVQAALAAFRTVEDQAPLQIEAAFTRLVDLLEEAAALTPGDTSARDRVTVQALARRKDADAVVAYVVERCGVRLGPLAGTGVTTTVAPPDGAGSTAVPPTTG